MLVLSRRENEKVLFPGLGITIEVIRTGSRKVQLGIDAPQEIRVIRSELDFQGCEPALNESAGLSESKIRNELSQANLAIQLAKNQIHQGLNENSCQVLDEALRRLRIIEKCLLHSDQEQGEILAVQESKSGYFVKTQSYSHSLASIIADEIQFDEVSV